MITEAADIINAVQPIMERPIVFKAREADGEPLDFDAGIRASARASSTCSARARSASTT